MSREVTTSDQIRIKGIITLSKEGGTNQGCMKHWAKKAVNDFARTCNEEATEGEEAGERT
jgi:hypothetical protein